MEIEFAPWDGRRVPVTLLAGYLGAGKTTTLNHLLARTDRPIAVLVNDVGEINIDQRLIARRHGDVVELTDGCICCSLANGLADAFEQLKARPSAPDHLVIELSGVADPTQVVPWARSPGFRLDSVVTMVDAEHIVDRLEDPLTSPLIQRQLDAADVVLDDQDRPGRRCRSARGDRPGPPVDRRSPTHLLLGPRGGGWSGRRRHQEAGRRHRDPSPDAVRHPSGHHHRPAGPDHRGRAGRHPRSGSIPAPSGPKGWPGPRTAPGSSSRWSVGVGR